MKEIFLGAFSRLFQALESHFYPLKPFPRRFFKDAEAASAGSEFTTLEHKRIEAGDNWLEKRMITFLFGSVRPNFYVRFGSSVKSRAR